MKFWLVASAVLIVAVALRASRLDIRPMHGDEAVHAYRFGQLLEENYYRYDPREFHGPTLNYFTLISAWLSGKHSYAALTETTLRIVPVFFGLLVVVMPLLLADGLGRRTVLIAAAITAISPAFVFYSRYYIPEMLLVCFTFGLIVSGYRYSLNKKWIWALRMGVFASLCFATKETSVIALAAMCVSLMVVLFLRRNGGPMSDFVRPRHLLLAVAGAVVVWGLFYSSFFTNPPGLLDSFRSYATYFSRAGGNQIHVHPWYYYLKLLIYNRVAGGPAWTEGLVVLLAVVGLIVIITKRGVSGLDINLLHFLALYTAITTVVYAAIPYKTPWCLLSFYQGMILLAAVGVVAILNSLAGTFNRVVVTAFFAMVAADLVLQAFSASFVSCADPSNPYVYAHPTKDVPAIARRIEEVSQSHPAGREMPVWVVCPNGDYWPLPWYLRSFKNVGWWNDVNGIHSPAPVIIASAGFEDRLITRIYDLSPPGQKNLYVPLFDTYMELRPQVELRGYITKDLCDKWRSDDAAAATAR